MLKNTKNILYIGTFFIVANLIWACSSGPSESDMLAACLKEGESTIQKNRDKQMGVNRDTSCKCAAKESMSIFSAAGRQALILGMQGKKEEARAITSKMSDSEQEAHLAGGLLVMKKCMGAG